MKTTNKNKGNTQNNNHERQPEYKQNTRNNKKRKTPINRIGTTPHNMKIRIIILRLRKITRTITKMTMTKTKTRNETKNEKHKQNNQTRATTNQKTAHPLAQHKPNTKG